MTALEAREKSMQQFYDKIQDACDNGNFWTIITSESKPFLEFASKNLNEKGYNCEIKNVENDFELHIKWNI